MRSADAARQSSLLTARTKASWQAVVSFQPAACGLQKECVA